MCKTNGGYSRKEVVRCEDRCAVDRYGVPLDKIDPPVVIYGNGLVLDYGNRVSVSKRGMAGHGLEAIIKRREMLIVALRVAREKFGEPVRFCGSEDFEYEIIDAAIHCGIQLEPISERGLIMYDDMLSMVV